MMNEINNLIFQNEFRMTFNYFRVIELFFDVHLKLFLKIYDHLFNLYHKCLFLINLKYAYFTILLHLNNRFYFVFIIFDIN